jgi:hypothetical protein
VKCEAGGWKCVAACVAAAPWLPAAQNGGGRWALRGSLSRPGRPRGPVPWPRPAPSPPLASRSSSTAHRGRPQTSRGEPAALSPGCSACPSWGPCLCVKPPA